jgi:hypothetical protein
MSVQKSRRGMSCGAVQTHGVPVVHAFASAPGSRASHLWFAGKRLSQAGCMVYVKVYVAKGVHAINPYEMGISVISRRIPLHSFMN